MYKKNYKKVNITIAVAIFLILVTIITPISLAIPRGHDVVGYGEGSSDSWNYPDPYQGFPNKNSFFSSGIKFKNNLGEYLIPDEYNLDNNGAGSYKWYPADMIVCQSFVPDCSKIGAFGVQFKFVDIGEDYSNLPGFKICLYPQTTAPYIHNGREYYLGPRPEVENPVWTRICSKTDADGWVGLEYGTKNWQSLIKNPDGFYHLEDQGYSPRYITVTPGKTYYIGLQLLGDHPREICGGYSLETTGNRYSQGCRCVLEWWDPHNVGFPPNYNVYTSSDICFCVWGWDYPPEMPCDPDPDVGERVQLVKYGEDRIPGELTSPLDGKIGAFLSCFVDDPDDTLLEVSFYGTIALNPRISPFDIIKEENLIGHSFVYSGNIAKKFWPDLVYSGDIPYVWAVVARDWGIQRLMCPRGSGDSSAEVAAGVWYFYTLPYNESEPIPPIVSDIPDQTVCNGQNFAQINLDDYVQDDQPDEEIVWTFSGNTDLGIEIIDRVAKIAYHSDFIGSETITFTATDQDGLSDSDDATFTVRKCVTKNVTILKEVRDYCEGGEYSKTVEVNLYEEVEFRLLINYKGGKTTDLIVKDKLPYNLVYQYIDSENYTPFSDESENTLTWEFNNVETGDLIEIIFGAKAVDTGPGENQAVVDSLEEDHAEDFATVNVIYEPGPDDDDDDDYVPPDDDDDDVTPPDDDDDDTPPCSTEVMIIRPLEEQPFLYIRNIEKFPFMLNVVIGALDINTTVVDTCGQVTNVKFFVEGEEKASIPYDPTTPYYTYHWDDRALFWNTIEVAAYAGTQKIDGASSTIDVFAIIL